MGHALQLRGIRKRFVAGVSGCLASADVLRGIDLDVDAGESVAVIGAPGSGKSTLLLCASGLLRSDAGTIAWFGDAAPLSAATRTHYCFSESELSAIGRSVEPRVYLLDLPAKSAMTTALADWIDDRCESGNAVIVAARNERCVQDVGRMLTLSGGVLHSARAMRSRVAEAVVGEPSPFC